MAAPTLLIVGGAFLKFVASFFGLAAVEGTVLMIYAAAAGWGGVRFVLRPEPATRAVGALFLARSAQTILAAPLLVMGGATTYFLASHFMTLATGFGLLFIGFLDYGARLRAAQQTVVEQNKILVGREQQLIDTNQSLTEMARRLEETNVEYAEARDRANAASHAKSQFLATVSHQLRTPLNAIIGFSELLPIMSDASVNGMKCAEYGGYIHDAGQHLLDIVNDLLDVAGIELESITPDPQPILLSELTRRAVVLLTDAAARKKIRLLVSITEGLQVSVDPRLMRQVIMNVVGNAIKFSPDGSAVTIEGAAIDTGGFG